MDWADRRCVVTGGAGFIGSTLVEGLINAGAKVIVVDDLSVGAQNVPFIEGLGAKFHKVDISELNGLAQPFNDIETVFHLAAMNRAQRSIDDPIRANECNVVGTLNCLKVALEKGVERFVFASSSSVYKGVENSLLSEDMSLKPLHPYGVGKLAGEHYVRLFNDLYGMPTTALRYFSVYGPRQRGDIDHAAVIPKFILAALEGRDLTVFGDGHQQRNFTFVKDVVRGNMLAGVSKQAVGEVINVAAEKEVSVNDIAETVLELVDTKSKKVHLPPLKGDPKRNPANISKAKGILRYQPQFSLEMGLKETIKSIQANLF